MMAVVRARVAISVMVVSVVMTGDYVRGAGASQVVEGWVGVCWGREGVEGAEVLQMRDLGRCVNKASTRHHPLE